MRRNLGLSRLYYDGRIEDLASKVNFSKPCKSYNEWYDSLPHEPIENLADACWLWIKAWGSGGGKREAEIRIKAAIIRAETDNPRELANAIYNSVAGCYIYPFEASDLTMDLLNDCLSEIRTEEVR